jgi:hypothetical protein
LLYAVRCRYSAARNPGHAVWGTILSPWRSHGQKESPGACLRLALEWILVEVLGPLGPRSGRI